jgi:hypothetical protein
MPSPKEPRETGTRTSVPEGSELVRALAEAEGGSFSLEEASALLRISSDQLITHIRDCRVVAWTCHGGHPRLPRWQFENAGLLTGIRQVLEIFRSQDQWRVMRYFLAKRQSLDNKRPLDLLRAREVGKVIVHARAHFEENTW